VQFFTKPRQVIKAGRHVLESQHGMDSTSQKFLNVTGDVKETLD